MQLNMTTDYALRLLLYLASEDRTVPSQEIAAHMNIPQKYITTIAAKLKRGRFIKTVQGANGGYVLERAPASISIYDVMCTMEGGVKISRCSTCNPDCVLHSSEICPLNDTYDSLQGLIETAFNEIMISDLVQKDSKGSEADGRT